MPTLAESQIVPGSQYHGGPVLVRGGYHQLHGDRVLLPRRLLWSELDVCSDRYCPYVRIFEYFEHFLTTPSHMYLPS